MREIKFKVWDKVHNKFIGVWAISSKSVKYAGQGYLLKNDDVDGSELLQFTGLKDKDNIEVYESDIIEFRLANSTKRVKGFIKWYDECFSFFCVIGQFPNQHTKFLSELYDIKVIGNIYLNNELLKGEN